MRSSTGRRARVLAPKVPEITLLFWVIKVLTTGMGEAMSDFLGHKSVPLAGAIGFFGFVWALRRQLRRDDYHAPTYWTAVMMVAVFGTMAADGLRLAAGLSFATTTPVFALAVAGIFVTWYRSEGTLSIHSITTRRRELYYWAAVLATFALGTAAGDLTALELHLGFLGSVWLFGAMIAVPAIAWSLGRLDGITTFWAAYVITRPLGASVADWFGKSHKLTGLGLGDGVVSGVALIAFVGLVAYVAVTRRDVQRPVPEPV